MRPSVHWAVTNEGDACAVSIFGEIDEYAMLDELRQVIGNNCDFDLSHVRRINSCGVREWLSFIRQIESKRFSFHHCSLAVVVQFNMISNFRGSGTVCSVMAPYVCDSCGHESEVEVNLADVQSQEGILYPAVLCPQCESLMVFDDLPERFFSFL